MMSTQLNMIGIIATILAMIFAAGALWNSITRRRHLEALQRSEKPEEDRISFRPPEAVWSGPSHAADKGVSPPVASSPYLFRQIRPGGEIDDPVPDGRGSDEDLYVWE